MDTAAIDLPALAELSGLASSRLRDDLLWAHNDGGNAPRLYAIRTDGETLGSIRIDGASDRDWEDIASFELDGEPYLVIGDVGDNSAARQRVSLLFVREPAVGDEGLPADAVVRPDWTVSFVYEDGPRDCESIAVDVPGKRVLLMTKRTTPPAVYAIPIRPSEGVAKKITERVSIPALDRKDGRVLSALSRFATQPTAMDLTADGRLAVVQTYTDAWLFRREPGQSWEQAFAGAPDRIRVPPLGQAEAIAFDAAGGRLFISGEGAPNPLATVYLARSE